MQGGLIFIATIASLAVPTEAFAADVPRRQLCSKNDSQRYLTPQQQQQAQQQRSRPQDCRNTRVVPPVVDPTPFFLL